MVVVRGSHLCCVAGGVEGWPLTRPKCILPYSEWRLVKKCNDYLQQHLYDIILYQKKDVKLYYLPYHSLFTLCYACHVNTNVDFCLLLLFFYDHYYYLSSGLWESVAPGIPCCKTAKTWRPILNRQSVFYFCRHFFSPLVERSNASMCRTYQTCARNRRPISLLIFVAVTALKRILTTVNRCYWL